MVCTALFFGVSSSDYGDAYAQHGDLYMSEVNSFAGVSELNGAAVRSFSDTMFINMAYTKWYLRDTDEFMFTRLTGYCAEFVSAGEAVAYDEVNLYVMPRGKKFWYFEELNKLYRHTKTVNCVNVRYQKNSDNFVSHYLYSQSAGFTVGDLDYYLVTLSSEPSILGKYLTLLLQSN